MDRSHTGACQLGVVLHTVAYQADVVHHAVAFQPVAHYEVASLAVAHYEVASLAVAHYEVAFPAAAHYEVAFPAAAHYEVALLVVVHCEKASLAVAVVHHMAAYLDEVHHEVACLTVVHYEAAYLRTLVASELGYRLRLLTETLALVHHWRSVQAELVVRHYTVDADRAHEAVHRTASACTRAAVLLRVGSGSAQPRSQAAGACARTVAACRRPGVATAGSEVAPAAFAAPSGLTTWAYL